MDGTKTMLFRIVPGEKDIQPSLVADIGENEHARKFVEEALGEWCPVSLPLHCEGHSFLLRATDAPVGQRGGYQCSFHQDRSYSVWKYGPNRPFAIA